MVMPQPKLHQVSGAEVKPYDVMSAQLGNKPLLDKLAGLPILDGVLIEDEDLDYTIVNLVEHKLGRAYRGWLVVKRVVPPCRFFVTTPADTTIADNAQELLDFGTEVYDDGGDHAAGIFTAPVDGIYEFEVSCYLSTSIADGSYIVLTLNKNGAVTEVAEQDFSNGSAYSPTLQVGARLRLAATDTIRALILQNSTAAATATVSTDAQYTWFRGWLVDEGLSEDKDWLDTEANDRTKFLPIRCSFDQTVSLWIF